jgi:TPR repeat protein
MSHNIRRIPLDEAIKWYQMAAKGGSAAAQFELGLAYTLGAGVPQDTRQAMLWCTKAAEQGDTDAQLYLGLSYAVGRRVSQDFSQAVKWLTKAAEQNNVDACFYLGGVYDIAQGTLKDTREAAKWYTKAAEQGHAEAQVWLAEKYHKGEGVLQDYKEAARWFTKAAEQGDVHAQGWLADMHHKGEGVRQDYKEAAKWYTRAAEQGDAVAQNNLALMYAMGRGVLEDYVEAYKWSILAATNGAEKAPRLKQMLREKMTPVQVEEGQRRAKEFTAAQQGRVESREALSTITTTTATGFLVTPAGYLLTARHAVEKASRVEVVHAEQSYPAQIILQDESTDVAVLKIEGTHFPCLPLVSSAAAKTGDWVFTMGFPQIQVQGSEGKFTEGSISALSGLRDNPRFFQISVPIQPGNSGGPLVNERGEVVGLIVSRLDDVGALMATGAVPQTVNYSLKSSFILPLIESVPGLVERLPKASATTDRPVAIQTAIRAVVLIVAYAESRHFKGALSP